MLLSCSCAGFLADEDDIVLDGFDNLVPVGGRDGGGFFLHSVEAASYGWRFRSSSRSYLSMILFAEQSIQYRDGELELPVRSGVGKVDDNQHLVRSWY